MKANLRTFLSPLMRVARQQGVLQAIRKTAWMGKTWLWKKYLLARPVADAYYPSMWKGKNTELTLSTSKSAEQPLLTFLLDCRQSCMEDMTVTLQSLHSQTHSSWEALLVYANAGEIQEIPANRQGESLHFRQVILSGPVFSNELLQETKGEWVCWLKPGSQLSPHMIEVLQASLLHNPAADVLYPDEGFYNAQQPRINEFFYKPDWSPELLLSVNYLDQAVYRKSLVSTILAGCAGTQFQDAWELALRCSEASTKIVHIPEVLILSRKPDPVQQTKVDLKVVADHLRRTGSAGAHGEWTKHGTPRYTWAVQSQKVSIIIPTLDNVSLLMKCVGSILKFTQPSTYEIILIDTGSRQAETFAYYDQLKSNPDIRLYSDTRAFNYSRVNNVGASFASTNHLLFLNNDTEVIEEGWLEELVRWVERPGVRMVGAKLLFADGAIQHAGIVMGLEGHASHVFGGMVEGHTGIFGSVEWYRNYSAVTGACMLVRRAVFEQVGGFDENYRLVFSDVKLGLDFLRAGYRVVYTPFARLLHHEGRSRARYMPYDDMELAYREFYDLVERGDSYYNPNLSYSVRIPAQSRRLEEGRIERLQQILRFAVKEPAVSETAGNKKE